MGTLDGKVALITGGGRGQGRSHALALAAKGADIVVADIAADIDVCAYEMSSREDLDETVRQVEALGRKAVGIVADMRSTEQVNSMVAEAVDTMGSIDILSGNHGFIAYSTVEEMSDEVWGELINVNLTGQFRLTRAVIPHMKRQGFGRIILTASHISRRGIGNVAGYGASKWGVVGLMKCLAYEVGQGITVNAICPTFVDTRMVMNESTYRLFCPEIENPTRQDLLDRIANQWGKGWYGPEEVSRIVTFLAEDPSGVYNGQVIDIADGLTAAMSV